MRIANTFTTAVRRAGALEPRALVVLAWLCVAVGVGALGCGPVGSGDDTGSGPPTASFTQSATAGGVCLVVQFTDTSGGNVTAWSWDFGDAGRRSERDPVVEFVHPGTYTVGLEVSGPDGASRVEKVDLVTIAGDEDEVCPPVPTFEADVTSGPPGTTVTFTDTTEGDVITSRSWDFGNGESSDEESPSTTYDTPGNYTVSLTVVGEERGEGTTEIVDYVTIGGPVAGFSCTPDPLEGFVPLQVDCTADVGAFADAWAWDLGGGVVSTARDPSLTVTVPGAYTLTQTATNELGVQTASTGLDAYAFSLGADTTRGDAPLSVAFTTTDGSGALEKFTWTVNGEEVDGGATLDYTFLQPGTYRVQVEAESSTSELAVTAAMNVTADKGAPVAGFSCEAAEGTAPPYVPFGLTCTADPGAFADAWSWDFGDGVGGSTERNASHVYTTIPAAGSTFTITQTGTIDGETPATATLEVPAYRLGIVVSPETGGAPLKATLSADDPAGLLGLWSWDVDGTYAGKKGDQPFTFLTPGTYAVQLVGAGTGTSALATTTVDVGFGPPAADFAETTFAGFGPLTARLVDLSAGQVDSWTWDFGDGERCTYPPIVAPEASDPPPCDAPSPLHTWATSGDFDVTLTVTGPESEGEAPPTASSSRTREKLVRVYLADGSFEEQVAGQEIGGAWTPLRPVDETQAAQHVAVASAPGGLDVGMPTAGQTWAVLEGLGTDGETPVEVIDNGITQTFLRPPDAPVLELDLVLIYAEPPGALLHDAVVATVTADLTPAPLPVEIPGSAADPATPYVGKSTAHPARPGAEVHWTAVLTASVNLQDAFPASDADTHFTLTIRTTNDQNDHRSPLVYVDDVRFTTPVDEIAPHFETDADLYRVGDDVAFTNRTCLVPGDEGEEEDPDCAAETSWRWDFGTQYATSPPDATGSGEPHPTYAYETRGEYEVELLARRADAEGTTTETVTVYAPVVASFDVVTEGPFEAGATIEFDDTSTVDPDETIDAWSWDFGGWGTSSVEDPGPILFPTVGTYTVTLTITTSTGETSTAQQDVVIE